jgi:quinol-cytochrome oxidoreductase complex cytochrome b subunit
MNAFWVLRWVLVALGLLLAIVLISSGAILIGLVIGALAVTRAAIILNWQARRRQRGR